MPRKSLPSLPKLYALGSFRVESEKGPIVLPARKVQSLLAFLALHPGEHAREKLAARFWGDSTDAQARDSLRTALKNLRKPLGDELLLADRETVEINPEFGLWTDVREFQDQVVANPEHAVALYRGDLLEELYDDWIVPERERLRELYLDALLRLAQDYRASGEYGTATEYAHKVLLADPANERAYQHLMLCSVALGDRSAALRQYDACVRALQTELGVEPSKETQALHEWIKLAPSEGPALAAQITNLPIALSSFIGRKKELAELKELFTATRLLTLTGTGGTGKSRLAIQVATDLIDQFHDGVWWVDLAPLAEDALVPQAAAQALGVREAPNQTITETLITFLRQKQALLILDNCEHLIAACARLSNDLLTHCAQLFILATSREALGLTGETLYEVPTLSVPARPGATPVAELMNFEGIRLFVARARAVRPDWMLTEKNAAAVLEICRRLDGIPLALELAAARVKLLTVEHIADRLNDRFNLLTQGNRPALPRQQTLRAMLDWSYDLLPEPARVLFRRLSVLAGGFSLEAAERICSEEPLAQSTLLDLLARLVDRSLVKMERQSDYARYRMLETIREYARGELDDSGEAGRMRVRHRDYFVGLAEEIEPRLKGSGQFAALDQLELEHDNVRAAWECAIESDAHLALRLVTALLDYWLMRGNPGEGREWVAQLLPRADGWEEAADRAQALGAAGLLAYSQRDFTSGRVMLERAAQVARAAHDRKALAFALLWQGRTAHRQRDDGAAQALTQECLAIYQELGDPWGIAMSIFQFAGVAAAQGRYAEAEEGYLKSLARYRELGDKFRAGYVLNGLGELARLRDDYERAGKFYGEYIDILREQRSRVALVTPSVNQAWVSLHAGDYQKARVSFEEALALSNEYGNRNGVMICLWGFAGLYGMTGKPERAARLYGAVECLLEARGSGRRMDASDQKEFDHYFEVVRAQLDGAAFDQARAEGRELTLEQAIALAVETEGAESRG